MSSLPVIQSRRICAACKHWCPNYLGPQTIGWCDWKRAVNGWRHPPMSEGSKYALHDKGKLLETHWDASCQKFEPK